MLRHEGVKEPMHDGIIVWWFCGIWQFVVIVGDVSELVHESAGDKYVCGVVLFQFGVL